MSCWVVPSVAAEFWGIPIAQVLQKAKAGLVPTKTELGFTLVDVAPHSPTMKAGIRPPAARPATFTPSPAEHLTTAERQALAEPNQPELTASEELELLDEPGEDEIELGTLDWRQARMAASRLRRPPRRMHAAA
jgi:hypothetical protein